MSTDLPKSTLNHLNHPTSTRHKQPLKLPIIYTPTPILKGQLQEDGGGGALLCEDVHDGLLVALEVVEIDLEHFFALVQRDVDGVFHQLKMGDEGINVKALNLFIYRTLSEMLYC